MIFIWTVAGNQAEMFLVLVADRSGFEKYHYTDPSITRITLHLTGDETAEGINLQPWIQTEQFNFLISLMAAFPR